MDKGQFFKMNSKLINEEVIEKINVWKTVKQDEPKETW